MTTLQSLARSHLTVGLLAYLLSSLPVLIGILFGLDFVILDKDPHSSSRPDFLTACSRYDGGHYKEIVKKGYSYNEKQQSTVAFFPGYPLLGKLVVFFSGWSPALALIVVSNLMLIAAFTAMAAFLQARWPDAAPRDRFIVLALFGVFPTTFFFRMTYSESTFLFALAMFLNGTARRWPPLLLAFIAGAATGIRPVGIACTAAFLWHVLSDRSGGPISRRALLAVACLPLACWGLLAYMAYQESEFDNQLGFAQTQEHWSYASDKYTNFWDKAEALLSAEPIWSVYDSKAKGHWTNIDRRDHPLFSLFFWNPILFVGALALVALGWSLLWLTGAEAALGLGLLAIPYVTRSYEMSMASHARFATVVIPAYLVAGQLMKRLPQWALWAVLAVFTAMLMVWSSLFAAGYYFF